MFLFWSCGDTKSKENTDKKEKKTEIKKKKQVKTIEQRKEEGKVIRAELEKYNLQIPENFIFKETLINAMAFKKSTFIADNVDETIRIELDNWFNKQSDDLVNLKWKKTILQKNDTISGILYNSYSFKKDQGGQSTLSDMLTISTAYNPRGTYSMYIKPYVIGEPKEQKLSKEGNVTEKEKLDKEERLMLKKKEADILEKKKRNK